MIKKPTPEPKPKLPEIYFDLRTGGLLMEMIPGRYVALSEPHIKTHIQRMGHDVQCYAENGVQWFRDLIARSQVKNSVDLACALSGYKAGLHELSGGKRVLVTESSKPVLPGPNSKIPKTKKFIFELLKGQDIWVLSWLKVAYETLANGPPDFKPGQLLVLAGPGGCGKTFFQWIVTQLLGGRSAKPYRYMTEKTQFNLDLAMAEHLPMGDVAASYDIRTRKNFASQIKEFCVEAEMSVHPKGKDATMAIPTFRRLTLSVNDEPEHLMIIPPLDNDLIPKIMLVKCTPAVLNSDREKNQHDFAAELPALARFLMEWEIPKEIRDDRFGVSHYQHPDLLRVVTESSPEIQLLVVVDEVIFSEASCSERRGRPDDSPNHEADIWRGSAELLKVELLKSQHASTASRLLEWPSACGTYLARLKQKYPHRFSQVFNNGKSVWSITKEKDQ